MRSFATCARAVFGSLLLLSSLAHGGVVCDGTGDFLLASNENAYDFVDQTWTVCAKFIAQHPTATRIIIAKGNGNPRWAFQIVTNDTINGIMKNAAGEDIASRTSVATVADGAMHTVCIVYTSHSTVRNSNTQTIYVDGVVSQSAQQNFGTGGFSQNADNLNICRLGNGGNLFVGTVEEVAIWSGDIGPAAALQYHSGGVKRPNIALPLVSYWPLWSCAQGVTCTTFADEGRTSDLTSTGAVGASMLLPMRGDIQ